MSSDIADFIFRKQITSRGFQGAKEKKPSTDTSSNGNSSKGDGPQLLLADKYVESYRKGRDYTEINNELQEFRKLLESQRNSSEKKISSNDEKGYCKSPKTLKGINNDPSQKQLINSMERLIGKIRMSNEGDNYYKNSDNSISFMTDNSKIIFENDFSQGDFQNKCMNFDKGEGFGKAIVITNPMKNDDELEILETARFRPEQEKMDWPVSKGENACLSQKNTSLQPFSNQNSIKNILDKLPKVNSNSIRTLLKDKNNAKSAFSNINCLEKDANYPLLLRKGRDKKSQIKSKTLKKLLGEKDAPIKRKDMDSKMILSIMDSDILSTNDDSAHQSNKKQTNISISIEEELGISISENEDLTTPMKTNKALEEILGKMEILKNLSILNEREKKLLEQAYKVVERKVDCNVKNLRDSAFVCSLTNLENAKDHTSMLHSNLFKDLFSLLNGLKITKSQLDSQSFSNFFGPSFIFLNLSSNNLKTDTQIFQGCQNLEFINLSFNQINSLSMLSCCKRLKEIHISNNLIEELGGLSYLPNLNLLDISHNSISSYENVAMLTCNKKLDLLNLTGNPIAMLPNYRKSIQVILPQLKGLDLSDYTSLSDFITFQDYAFNNAMELKTFQNQKVRKREKSPADISPRCNYQEKTVVKSARTTKEFNQLMSSKQNAELLSKDNNKESLFFVPKGVSNSALNCPKVFLRLKSITGSVLNGQTDCSSLQKKTFSNKYKHFEREYNHSAERQESLASRTIKKNEGANLGICVSQGSLTSRDNLPSTKITNKKRPDIILNHNQKIARAEKK